MGIPNAYRVEIYQDVTRFNRYFARVTLGEYPVWLDMVIPAFRSSESVIEVGLNGSGRNKAFAAVFRELRSKGLADLVNVGDNLVHLEADLYVSRKDK